MTYHSATVERASPPSGAAAGRRRGRRPPPPELVERRRAEIIEAAYEVFSAKGYNAAGIADIAERLGIGHGTFYRYFENKRDILDHVVDYGVERIVAALALETAQPAGTLEEFRDQLRRIGERLFALLDSDPGLGQVVLMEATSIDEEMTQRVLGLMDTFGALAAAYLKNGIARGFLREDLDTVNVGRAITALTLPGLFAAVRGQAGPQDRARYTEAMVALVCEGIAPPKRGRRPSRR
jgi:AcrR family transcriptional regulator